MITIRSETEFNINELKHIFVEENTKIFIGCIEYKSNCLFFFQQPGTPKPFQYFIAEFPLQGIEESDFEDSIAAKIDQCCSKKDIKFRGFISYKSILYLIFIQ